MDIVRFIYRVIKLLFNRRVNLTSTLYLNFKAFPISEAILLPIIVDGKLECELQGHIVIKNPSMGVLRLGDRPNLEYGRKDDVGQLKIDMGGVMTIHNNGGCCRICRGFKIIVRQGGKLCIESSAYFGPNCQIQCKREVLFMSNFSAGWNLTILDSDNHYMMDMETKKICNNSAPIFIGYSVWCANNVTISKGVRINNHVTIGSHSLVNKSIYEENCVAAGIPTSIVKRNIRRVWDREEEVNKYFTSNPNEEFTTY